MLTTLAIALAILQATAGPSAVLEPGHEAKLLQAMTPASGELPEGWALLAVRVEADRVEAVYGPQADTEPPCDEASLCVTLRHPSEGVEAFGFFALGITGLAPTQAPRVAPGVRARLDTAMARDPWKRLAPPEPEAIPPPTLPPTEAAFRALLSSEPELLDRVLQVTVTAQSAALRLRTDGGPELTVRLSDRPHHLSNPAETTQSFHVRFEGGLVQPPDLPSRVMAALRAADVGALRLSAAPTFEDHTGTWLHTVLWWLASGLLLALLLALPGVARATVTTLGKDPVTWGIIAAGVALRLALPGRMIEFGIGVLLTDYAEHLIMPRYGPAVPTLHHALFALFGTDHNVIVACHRVMGCLMLPVACAAGLHLFRERRATSAWLAPLWAFGLAFTPMLLRAEATESNLQPALFAFWVALLGWLACGGWVRHVALLGGLGFTMLARPELVLIAPAAWLLLCRPWRDAPRSFALLSATLLLLAPWQFAHVLQRTAWEVGASSLAFDEAFFRYHLWVHLGETALIEPRIAPLMTTLLGLAGLLIAGAERQRLWLLALGGLAWIGVYAVDLSSASAPRLHVAGLQAWTLVAAASIASLSRGDIKRLAVICALWLASAAYTVPWLWAATNEDTEETLLQRLEASALGDPPPIIATLHHVDAPEEQGHGTHRYFPHYRFADGSVIPLGQIAEHLHGDREVLLYQGVNCYAALDRDERGGSGLLSACREVHQRLDLEPVWVDDIPNRGNPRFQELGYYGPEPTLQVGVWRVRGQ
ncbi:MAG: hypothetical protein ACPGU1_21245 [Myxococcota bacterium]